MSQKHSETQRHTRNLTRKSLGFTRYLETVSCPEQAVFFDGQAFRGDPFNPTYIAYLQDFSYETCVFVASNFSLRTQKHRLTVYATKTSTI